MDGCATGTPPRSPTVRMSWCLRPSTRLEARSVRASASPSITDRTVPATPHRPVQVCLGIFQPGPNRYHQLLDLNSTHGSTHRANLVGPSTHDVSDRWSGSGHHRRPLSSDSDLQPGLSRKASPLLRLGCTAERQPSRRAGLRLVGHRQLVGGSRRRRPYWLRAWRRFLRPDRLRVLRVGDRGNCRSAAERVKLR